MKLTKYEHACLLVEIGDQKIVIDPGAYSKSLGTPQNVAAIVVTHAHPDHFDPEVVRRIADANPEVKIFAHESMAESFSSYDYHSADAGRGIEIGPFHLEFFGGTHAEVHPSIPLDSNLGVMVNDTLYYPGDSFTNPHKMVKVLALPTDAPWLKFRESVDFLVDVKPQWAFSTHDAFASESGYDLIDRMVGMFAKKVGSEYRRLEIGNAIEL